MIFSSLAGKQTTVIYFISLSKKLQIHGALPQTPRFNAFGYQKRNQKKKKHFHLLLPFLLSIT